MEIIKHVLSKEKSIMISFVPHQPASTIIDILPLLFHLCLTNPYPHLPFFSGAF